MQLTELILIAVGLSMDAFAVAICRGLKMPARNLRQMWVVALFFGGFQALMPLLGWLVGRNFADYIVRIDHWIAFILLAVIGGKMIWEALTPEEDCGCGDGVLDLKELLGMAVATSIDALAVGVTFSFLQVAIVPAVTLIGVITFGLSAAGVLIGHHFGAKFRNQAELAGGIILIGIGLKILLEHLGILS